MHYRADDSKIRDAKEAVDDAKRQIEIANLEKEIDILEDQKDLLNEQITLLDERADKINEYYDEQIKQTEAFYDSQIKALEKQRKETEVYFESITKNLENTKSKFQELTEILEKAELSAKLKQLGIDEEALLNGSEEEFNKLKDAYMGIVTQLNAGNDDILSSLQELSGYDGTAPAVLSDTTKKLDEMNTQLDNSTDNMDKLSTSATTASTSTSAIATNMGELSTSTEGLSDNLTDINDALTAIPESDKFDNLAASFSNLGEAIKGVADALGISEDEAVSGLVGALQEISTLSLDGAGGGEEGSESTGGGIISQFQTLKTAVEDVTSAISGGGGSSDGDASGSSSASMSAGAGGEGASGLIGAIEQFKSATDEALGGGEESEDGGNGAIPQFKELETAVNDVTAVIGSEDSEGGENTLIGALRTQYETASEVLPEEKALFDELLESITACVSALNNMVSVLGSIPEIGGSGSISVTPHAKGTVGDAFAKGTGGLPKAEKNALVSEYGQTEMTVLPNGKTIITDKPTMMDLPKDTVIYNEEQTKKIMDNKIDVQVVKSYASGVVEYSDGTIVRPDGTILEPYDPDKDDSPFSKLYKAWNAHYGNIDNNVEEIKNLSHHLVMEHSQKMNEEVNRFVSNSNIVNNNRNVQPVTVNQNVTLSCPNVTNNSGIEYVQKELSNLSLKAYQEPLKDW